MSKNQITSFQGEHRFLSNFWPARVRLDGAVYPTVEHAYQAGKFSFPHIQASIRTCRTPGEAKRLSRKYAVWLREGWEQDRLALMEDLVRQKFFDHPELAARLLDTGNAEITEGNTWNDRFWGVCRGEGQNHLGRILMKVRAALREESAPRELTEDES